MFCLPVWKIWTTQGGGVVGYLHVRKVAKKFPENMAGMWAAFTTPMSNERTRNRSAPAAAATDAPSTMRRLELRAALLTLLNLAIMQP